MNTNNTALNGGAEDNLNVTKIGIKTAASVVLIALIQGVLSFYRAKVLITAYGDNVNGIVQVALQISAYLVLFQTGMSAAYQFKMYEPLTNGEYNRISSLFSGLQKSMFKVSSKMLLISLLVVPVYSAILLNKGVRYWDTLLILAAIGIRICAPYFFTLPERCLIEIKEKKYVVITVEGVKDIVTLCAEIALMGYTKIPLPVILCVNLVFLALSKLVYLRYIRKYYGKDFDLKSIPEYASTKMTKAVYAHQISSVATSNSDNVVLSIFSTLKNVTIYSNFSLLMSYPIVVISRIIEGMRATLALKITRNDEDSYNAFKELLSFSFFCICIIVPVFILIANPFVSLWMGEEYQIPIIPLLLFALILADHLFMPTVYAARDARGLYEESKGFAISQAIVNVALSIALAIPFGITGVLSGTFAACYVILQPGNFKLVYSKVFNRKMTIYFDLLAVAAICAISYFVAGFAIGQLFAGKGWLPLIEKAVVSTVICSVIAFAGLLLFNSGFKLLMRRFIKPRKAVSA